MTRPPQWLKYVGASSVSDKGGDFAGMSVEGPWGDRLGAIDGFIVDSASMRPYYVVVDTGGWFKSRHFLLPVGHTQFDGHRRMLLTQLSRGRIGRFPPFERDRLGTLSDQDWGHFNNETCQACTVVGVSIVYAADEPPVATFKRSDYTYPDWWRPGSTMPNRPKISGLNAGVRYPTRRATGATRSDRGRGQAGPRRKVGDSSPHDGGRAQPGDVLGVETGGERTHVGDTAEDENKRRRHAEASAHRSNR